MNGLGDKFGLHLGEAALAGMLRSQTPANGSVPNRPTNALPRNVGSVPYGVGFEGLDPNDAPGSINRSMLGNWGNTGRLQCFHKVHDYAIVGSLPSIENHLSENSNSCYSPRD